MTNLQVIGAQFNNKVKITNNGGKISVDGGLILMEEFLHQTNFRKLVDRFIPFRKKRSNGEHSYEEILELVLLQLFAGYQKDKAHKDLKDDPAIQCLSEKEKSASQPIVSRF